MTAYYNEYDPKAAAWLRELIKRNLIAPGDVDERSIVDVDPTDLAGYTQCHFFAGIGVWSYALRQAGWPDDRPVWTGSCPCQPFSSAGKRKGTADERHLWPHLFRLIEACRPVSAFGEQVASKDGLAWLDSVQADLEGAGYATGAVDSCAAGVGAPHIRQRLYWLAHSESGGERSGIDGEKGDARQHRTSGVFGGLADANGNERGAQRDNNGEHDGDEFNTTHENSSSGLAEPESRRPQQQPASARKGDGVFNPPAEQTECLQSIGGYGSSVGDSLPTNGFWGNVDWLFCRDGKWRCVEPGTFPLVNGTPARVGRLRGYGNAIVAPQAQAFIEAFMDIAERKRGENE